MRKELTPEEFQQKVREVKAYFQIERRIEFLEQYLDSFKFPPYTIIEHKTLGKGLIIKSEGKIANEVQRVLDPYRGFVFTSKRVMLIVAFDNNKFSKLDLSLCYQKGLIKSDNRQFNRLYVRYAKCEQYYKKLLIKKAARGINFKIPIMVFMYLMGDALNKGKAA